MSSGLVHEVLAVAHFYDIRAAIRDCVTAVCAGGLRFCTAASPFPSSDCADPLAMIALAEKLQAREGTLHLPAHSLSYQHARLQ